MDTISELRTSLLDSMDKLKNGKMDVNTANAIANLGTVIVKTAETEIKVMRMTGVKQTSFIPLPDVDPEAIAMKTLEAKKD